MRRAVVTFIAIVFLCAGVALTVSVGGDSSRVEPRAARAEAEPTTTIDQADQAQAQAERVQEYVAAVTRQQVGDYLHARQTAEVASLPAPPAPEPTPSFAAPELVSPQVNAGGGHSDAWWTGVAQCEQGGRNDPFFGYFSFMDGSMGGQPWSVQVAAGNALLASVGSESPAWAPACVAAGYAASPGG